MPNKAKIQKSKRKILKSIKFLLFYSYKQFCKKNLCCLYNLTKKKDSYIVNSISINEEKEAS